MRLTLGGCVVAAALLMASPSPGAEIPVSEALPSERAEQALRASGLPAAEAAERAAALDRAELDELARGAPIRGGSAPEMSLFVVVLAVVLVLIVT